MNNNIFFNHSDLKSLGQNSIIGKTVRIRNPELVSIGNNVIIDDFTYISGKISIGDYVHIGASCSLQASKSEIVMGDFSALASGVRVFAASADYINCSFNTATVPESSQFGGIIKKIILGDFVWIGANSVILPGVNLPAGFVSGALTKLIEKNIYKPWSIYDMNTDKCIRRIGVDKIINHAKKLTNKDY